MFAVGLFDHPAPGGATQHGEHTARTGDWPPGVAEQATVLLQNRNGMLPLSPRVGSIAVIGHDAGAGTQIEENGSPAVLHGPVVPRWRGSGGSSADARGSPTRRERSASSRSRYPAERADAQRRRGHGLSASYFTGQAAAGRPSPTRVDPTVDFASKPAPLHADPQHAEGQLRRVDGNAHPAATGLYRFSLKVAGVAQLYLNGRLIVRGNAEFARGDLPGGFVLAAGRPDHHLPGPGAAAPRITRSEIRVQYATGVLDRRRGAAGRVAAPGSARCWPRRCAPRDRAKVAIVFANDVTSEGHGPHLAAATRRPGPPDRGCRQAANPRTIVVLHTAGPVLMPWLSKVAGVIEAWYPGQQSGTAIAATLFGGADPAGRLPVTFPRAASQGPATQPPSIPGIDNLVHYAEGIFVGYRYYDQLPPDAAVPVRLRPVLHDLLAQRLDARGAGGGVPRRPSSCATPAAGRRTGRSGLPPVPGRRPASRRASSRRLPGLPASGSDARSG